MLAFIGMNVKFGKVDSYSALRKFPAFKEHSVPCSQNLTIGY
jgi:hypothetical protein